MFQHYFMLNQIPDLTLSKYSSLDESGVPGVLSAHQSFWRQLNRKGLLNAESFHLFYEFNPERPKGNKLRIGLRVDSQTAADTFIEQTIRASALSPFYQLQAVDAAQVQEKFGVDLTRRYRYSSHLVKMERFLQPIEYGKPPYYLTSQWGMNDGARLYNMAKLMASIDKPCMYVVSIYPRDWAAEMNHRLDRTMTELRNAGMPQVSRTGGGIGMKDKDEHAKSTLDYYEDLLEGLSENPHFMVDVRVMSDEVQHACAILDAAASEALQEGAHTQRPYEENLCLTEVEESRLINCASENAPPALSMLPQLFLLEELSSFAVFPALYAGEWIEIPKETVPDDYASGMSLGLDDTGHEILFPMKNLSKHAFLAGVPGSGKTNSMMHLIGTIHGKFGIPVLIFEPAKHEYRAITCVEGLTDVELFSPSASTRFPLHINPFEFPLGMTLAEHIRNLIAVFDGAFTLEPPMPFLLDASVEAVYAKHHWMPSMINTGKLEYPTMSELYANLEERLEQTDYSAELKGNMKSALQVRIGSLITREMADVFDVKKSSIKPDDWMKRSAIIELESLGKDPANFTTLLVATLIRETLKTVNYIKPKDGRPRHVMFFEEAHNLIGPTAEKVAGANADPKQAATAYIVKMLAEVRALGEGIIIADQLPTAMAPEVIKNTSLKIGLRITAKDDRELLGGTMNANPDQLEKFSIFNPGHALVSYEPLLKPFEVQLPYFKAKEGDLDDKTILTYMLRDTRYLENLNSSLQITSAMWRERAKHIREKQKAALADYRDCTSRLSEMDESDDRKLRLSLRDRLNNAIDTLSENFDNAEKLMLAAVAYQSPFQCLMVRDKLPRLSGPVRECLIRFCDGVKEETIALMQLLKSLLADINEIRTSKGYPPMTLDRYKLKFGLYKATHKTWDQL